MNKYELFCEKVKEMQIRPAHIVVLPYYEKDIITKDLKLSNLEFYEFANRYANGDRNNKKKKAVAKTTTKQKN